MNDDEEANKQQGSASMDDLSKKRHHEEEEDEEEEDEGDSSNNEEDDEDDSDVERRKAEYEKMRQERINRNQQLLETLGLKQTIALSLTPTKPSNNSQVFDESGADMASPKKTKKRKKEPPETSRTSSRISTNKRKSSYKEQEEMGGKKLEEEILALVIKRAKGRMQQAKFLSELHKRFPKEIMMEKLENLPKPSAESVEYINEFLVPILYNVTYEDDEYLAYLCAGPEKAVKNLVLAFNAAVVSNYTMNFSLLISVFTNITSRSKKLLVLQTIDLYSVIDSTDVPVYEFLYLLRNIVLSDTPGKRTNEWFSKKKSRETMAGVLGGILTRLQNETDRKSECYSLFIEVCAILSRDKLTSQIVKDTLKSSQLISVLEMQINAPTLPKDVLTSVYLCSHIPLANDKEEKKLLKLAKQNRSLFQDTIPDNPWIDFSFIEDLLNSSTNRYVALGVLAFDGCYDVLDATFYTLKNLLTSEEVANAIENVNDTEIKTIYLDLVEKVKHYKEEDDEEEGEEPKEESQE
ncbi:hypothetical protein C9374_009096 [Naegleria lovaniensis]|uniref:Uncharacterized protein n=1 Tax=Naegleria lovaniensis TaxID=51637 RepID=A0AA88GI94_NAELO|nr:uncharacterized protein C9374_009096 [Naegleria lovaniensis]KAG2377580.1 hypothetical protein C9374_009096 [Naegleria lovaniensis]